MAEPSTTAPEPCAVAGIHRVTVEMAGNNLMVRSVAAIDLASTSALVELVNAAAETGVVVVIDPEQVPCDDGLASSRSWSSATRCLDHDGCRPADVELVASGVIRIAGRTSWWTIDIAAGRFCQSDEPIDCRFVDSAAWTALVAVWISPTQLSALTTTGAVITSDRAHRPTSERPVRPHVRIGVL